MCSVAAAAAALPIFGGAVSAYGANYEGRAQEKYYNYLAASDEQQAGLVEDTAFREGGYIARSATAAQVKVRTESDRVLGTERATLAANGNAGSATAEDIQRDTVTRALRDEEAIRYNADLQIYEGKRKADEAAFALKNRADQYRVAGQNARFAGTLNTIGSLLGTAKQVGGTYATYGMKAGG